MKKSNKIKFLFISLITFTLIISKSIFPMRKNIVSRKVPKKYSRPIDREKNSTPGTLQELLIASGYFL